MKHAYETTLNHSSINDITFNWGLTLNKSLQALALFLICNAAFAVCDAELENAIGMSNEKNPDVQMGANWYRYNHAQSIKNPGGSATADVFIRAIKNNEDGIARGQIIATNFGQAKARAHVSYHQYDMCVNKWHLNFIQNRSNRPAGNAVQPSIQNNSPNQGEQQNQAAQQQSQQQAQQTQQLAAQNQARADQARQGKRKTHDPAAEAHECISIDPDPGLFGAFKNTCSYKVNFNTCNYKPRVRSGGFNWSADFDCEQQKFGLHTPDGGRAVASHNRNTEMVYWFACKAPAFPVDGEFTVGRGIQARCN